MADHRTERPRPLVRAEYRPARDTLITTAGLLTTSAAGAVASLLLVLIAGGGAATDAVVAGYSVFLVVALFAATVRPVLIPRFGSVNPEDEFRVRAVDIAGCAALTGVVTAGAVALLSPVMVLFLSGTIPPSERDLLIATLLILSPASYLVMRAAADSAILAAGNRFSTSALVYAGSSIVTVGVTAALLPAAGAIGLAAGALVGSLVLAAGHAAVLHRHGARLVENPRRLLQRQQWRLSLDLVVAGALPLAWQAQLALSLGFVSGEAGEVTAYAYAYYLVTAFLALPASAAMVTLPRLVECLGDDPRRATVEHAAKVTPALLLVVAALMSCAVAYGDPIASWALDGPLGARSVDTLLASLAALAGMAVANTILLVFWPVAASLGRQRALALVAVSSLALLVAGAAIIRRDTVGVAIVQSAVSVASLLVAVYVLLGRSGSELLRRLACKAAPAAGCVAVVAGVRALAGDGGGPLQASGLAVGSLLAFIVIAAAAWPRSLAGLPGLSRLGRRT
jgi:O-antigen/teichoic acid export membrane protein